MPAHEEKISDFAADEADFKVHLRPRDLDAVIQRVEYYVFPGTTLTVCALIHINGTIVTGESITGSAGRYNKASCEAVAFNRARLKLWELERFLLRENLHPQESAFW